jgi:hypothetical protein
MPTVASGSSKATTADRIRFCISDLKASGIDPDGIRIGDRLTFETVTARKGGMKASNVRRA